LVSEEQSNNRYPKPFESYIYLKGVQEVIDSPLKSSPTLCPSFRGRLHVYESVYESPYDSVHDFYANRISFQFFFCPPLQLFVFTFQPKKNQKLTCSTPLAANRTPNRMGIRMENRICRRPLRVRLHVYESVYESPCDSVHYLLTKGLGFLFSITHPVQPFVNTILNK
jgi:hypothetical protein